ncbi:hypothetical protein KL941_002953 [Ogataea angusta]|nr:hypothetical protein KL941_002953 [Ogataea angusta]
MGNKNNKPVVPKGWVAEAPPPYSEVVDKPAAQSAGSGSRINLPSTAKPQTAHVGAPQQYPQYTQPYAQPAPYGQPAPYAQPAPYPQQYPANYNQSSRSRFGGLGGMGMLGGLGAGALGGLLLGEMMTPDTVIYENGGGYGDFGGGGGDFGGGDFGGDF